MPVAHKRILALGRKRNSRPAAGSKAGALIDEALRHQATWPTEASG